MSSSALLGLRWSLLVSHLCGLGSIPELIYMGSVVDREALRSVSLKNFDFPSHEFILPIDPQSSLSVIQGWYNRLINDGRKSGLGSTPVPRINNKTKTNKLRGP
jgi:hypothetical protein